MSCISKSESFLNLLKRAYYVSWQHFYENTFMVAFLKYLNTKQHHMEELDLLETSILLVFAL